MKSQLIHQDMTLLEAVQLHPATTAVFRSNDEQAGECILCNALFETIGATARRYGLNLEELLADLEHAAQQES